MGIEIHAFNFLRLQALKSPLGNILTVGRQSLNVSDKYIKRTLGRNIEASDGYCEELLLALNAKSVSSIDFSSYEGATYVADLNANVSLDKKFDCIIDAGSLEHIFDVATAFKNLVAACALGGRIIHILPINNLSGHGFWQFSSDLIYSLYSENNGFCDTQVYYASSLDFSCWHEIHRPSPGERVEVVSVEPLILLSVTRKSFAVESISAVQPFYLTMWNDAEKSSLSVGIQRFILIDWLRRRLSGCGKLFNVIRNTWLILGLATGTSRFSIVNSRFAKKNVEDLLEDARKNGNAI